MPNCRQSPASESSNQGTILDALKLQSLVFSSPKRAGHATRISRSSYILLGFAESDKDQGGRFYYTKPLRSISGMHPGPGQSFPLILLPNVLSELRLVFNAHKVILGSMQWTHLLQRVIEQKIEDEEAKGKTRQFI